MAVFSPFISFLKKTFVYICVYLAVPGLSCGTAGL